MRSKFSALAVVLLCTVPSLSAATLQFSARRDIPTGAEHLTGLAVADFNGDGRLDIAVTDDYAQKILVYLNQGNGVFSAPVITTLNVSGIGGLGALVSGDVNEDGKQDLIVAPVAGNQVDIVLLGNGDGTFTQGEFVPGSYGFLSASLVDINGDKHLDLVSGQNGATYVALGDGDGNFTQQPTNSASGLYLGLTVGDFNGDKHLDFVTTNYVGDSLQFYPGNGDGTFGAPIFITSPVLSKPASLVSADFNGDGKLDLLLGGFETAVVFLGNGDGTFQTALSQRQPIVLAPITNRNAQATPIVASGDMNNDGHPDIVAADDNSDELSILLNDGAGNFPLNGPNFTAPLDAGSGAVMLADLNGDGLPDVVVTNYKTGNISLFLSIVPKLTPTLSVQSSQAQALVGSSVIISVQVTGAGSTPPTGAVTLASGSTTFGQQALSSSGAATFTLPNLAVGQYPLTASYSGDSNYLSATNAATTQSITDFQVVLPTASNTVQAGASATFPIALSALGGFTGTVAVSCTGLPAGYTCSPATATVSASTSTVDLIVSPPPTAAHLETDPADIPYGRPVVVLTCLVLAFHARKRRRLLSGITLTLAFACLLPLAGCSGGKSSSPEPSQYTGTSNFIITVSATQSSVTISHQLNATLVVQ